MSTYIIGENASGEDINAEMDSIGAYPVMVDAVHHHIHEGDSYTTAKYYSAVGATASVRLLVYVPVDAESPHITFETSATKAYLTELYEAPTVSAHTGSLTLHNRDRASTNVTTVKAWATPTVSADGTLLSAVVIGSTTGNVKLGGANRGTQEFALAASTYYQLKMTSLGATNTIIAIADFYQEGD